MSHRNIFNSSTLLIGKVLRPKYLTHNIISRITLYYCNDFFFFSKKKCLFSLKILFGHLHLCQENTFLMPFAVALKNFVVFVFEFILLYIFYFAFYLYVSSVKDKKKNYIKFISKTLLLIEK